MFSAIVLAAGPGSRFGFTKQLMSVDGKPLIQHAVDVAAASGAGEILIVIGSDADRVRRIVRVPEQARFVINTDFEQGMSTSLESGLLAADPTSPAALILLADQPTVTAFSAKKVAAAWDQTQMPVVRAKYRGGATGYPVMLSAGIFDDVLLLEGDAGADEFIEDNLDLVHDVPVDDEPPPDIDTREDYERMAGPKDAPVEEGS